MTFHKVHTPANGFFTHFVIANNCICQQQAVARNKVKHIIMLVVCDTHMILAKLLEKFVLYTYKDFQEL